MNEMYEESIVGNYCTLLNPYNGYTEGRVVEDCGIEVVVLLTNGKEIVEYRDEVLIKVLAKWVETAKIAKKITYHTSRHTFATMMLTLGADLHTVSKLLGHANVKTTQIYAKIVDSKKAEAVNLVDSVFD